MTTERPCDREASPSGRMRQRARTCVVATLVAVLLLLATPSPVRAASLSSSATTTTTRSTTGRTRGASFGSSGSPRNLRDVTDSTYHHHRRRQRRQQQQQRQHQRHLQGGDDKNEDNKKTQKPSEEPTLPPTLSPTVSPAPSFSPTESPMPSAGPSALPSSLPSAKPSDAPSSVPSGLPSTSPTVSHAPTTSPQPTSVAFEKTQQATSDGSVETVLSCPTSDLPNDKYLYPLVTNDVSFQYGAVLHSQVEYNATTSGSSAVQELLRNLEWVIQKTAAWHYLDCDYQSDFVYRGFYVHAIGTGDPDQVQPETCNGEGGNANTETSGGTGGLGTSSLEDTTTTTQCITVTARLQLQLVLYPERRELQADSGSGSSSSSGSGGSEGGSSTSDSSSTSAAGAQWGLDGRVVRDLGEYLTAMLRDPQTWQEVPDVKSTQFMGFVNPSQGQQDGTSDGSGTEGSNGDGGSSSSNTANSSSSQGSSVLAVLPWIAIALAVLVLGAAMFLVVRHRRNKTKHIRPAKNSVTDESSARNPPPHEQTYLEDSYSDIVAHATSRSRQAPFDFGDDSTYNDDDLHNMNVRTVGDGRRRGGGLTIPDESTVRSDLGYSIEPMDYTNIGPSNSFDSEWTDANRSLFNLDKPAVGDEKPSEDSSPASGGDEASADGGAASEDPKPAPPARLINASLAMRAPHVGSARNKAKASAPNSSTSGRRLDNTGNTNDNTVDL